MDDDYVMEWGADDPVMADEVRRTHELPFLPAGEKPRRSIILRVLALVALLAAAGLLAHIGWLIFRFGWRIV